MPKKGSINLDELSDTDYSDLKQISEKYKDESGILDIKGFTDDLKTNYNVDLKEWYKTGSKDAKDKLVNQIFGSSSNDISENIISELESPSLKPDIPSAEFISFDQIASSMPNGKSLYPEVHYASNPLIGDIENTSLESDFSQIGNDIKKDESFTESVTNALGQSEGSNRTISDKLDMLARVIGGATDSINANTANAATAVASSIRNGAQSSGTSGAYNSKVRNTVYSDV